MGVLGDAGRRGDQIDEFVGPIHRLNRGDAKLFQVRFGQDAANQVYECWLTTVRRAWRASLAWMAGGGRPHISRRVHQVHSPAAQIDSAKDNFTIAGLYERVHFADDSVYF